MAVACSRAASGVRSRARTTWVSGSPNRQLNSTTAGPADVSASPAYSSPRERRAAPLQLRRDRRDDLGHQLLRQARRRPRQRRVGAHAAGVGAAVAVADPLEVLRGQQRHHGRAVDEAEQRHLRPVEVGLQEHRVAAVEERAGVRAGGVQVCGHHHALARGEPVVLDDVGRREAGQRGVEAGGVVDDLRRRRADARRRHHVLGERLGALDARGGGAGAEAGDARAADGVGDARHQRDLGADHDEVGRPALGQCRDGAGVGDVDAVLLGDRGRARVARRARQRGDAGVLRERENDRMLTSTGTDHEDAHDGTS